MARDLDGADGAPMSTAVRELRSGVTVYFGVTVAGAMFAVGDGHVRQDHGQVTGVAVEAATRTRTTS